MEGAGNTTDEDDKRSTHRPVTTDGGTNRFVLRHASRYLVDPLCCAPGSRGSWDRAQKGGPVATLWSLLCPALSPLHLRWSLFHDPQEQIKSRI